MSSTSTWPHQRSDARTNKSRAPLRFPTFGMSLYAAVVRAWSQTANVCPGRFRVIRDKGGAALGAGHVGSITGSRRSLGILPSLVQVRQSRHRRPSAPDDLLASKPRRIPIPCCDLTGVCRSRALPASLMSASRAKPVIPICPIDEMCEEPSFMGWMACVELGELRVGREILRAGK